ncbi:hypothetical protein [Robertmurraya sp.]|uniref:hypothetical protein n=1 Tax=Robertmurraya sp. TaxID=2837525 RepID=UPI003704D444
MSEHYVYAVFVEKRLKYIGMGKGSRFEHGCSGCSHVFGLNEAYFDGKNIEVGIIKDRLAESEASRLELSLIWGFGSSEHIALFNNKGNTLQTQTYPNMTEAEFYAECNIIRDVKYVRGEYARKRNKIYSDKNRGEDITW